MRNAIPPLIALALVAPTRAQTGLESEPPQAATLALVLDAYDGDTLTVEAAPWPDWAWTGSVRVLGVDTPEIRGECDQEKRWAITSRDYVRDLLIDESVALTDVENDKYGGRVLATVTLSDGRVLTDLLIEGNYGRAYDGGERGDWCDESLVMPSTVPPASTGGTTTTGSNSTNTSTTMWSTDRSDPNHPLNLYDDNGNGRITCAEARAHGIAPVYEQTPDIDDDEPYDFMTDRDGDGVVCEDS